MSPMLKVKISQDLDRAIGRVARRRHSSKAEWVRSTLERALAEEAVVGDALDRRDLLKASTADIEAALDEIDAKRE